MHEVAFTLCEFACAVWMRRNTLCERPQIDYLRPHPCVKVFKSPAEFKQKLPPDYFGIAVYEFMNTADA